MSALPILDTRYEVDDEKLLTTSYDYNKVYTSLINKKKSIGSEKTIFFSDWKKKKFQYFVRPTEFFKISSSDECFDNFFPNIIFAINNTQLKINKEFVNKILIELKELSEKHIIHSVDYLYENLEPALCQEKFKECNSLYLTISKRSDEYHEQIFVTMLSIASRWRKHFDVYNEFFKETEKKLLEKHSEKEVNKILKGWKKYVG